VDCTVGDRIAVRDSAELSAAQLYGILRLRVAVFVVEQHCAYQDLDDRDLVAGTVHCWVEDRDCRVVSCLRVMPSAGRWRIGRVCTAADHRGHGHAAGLMRAALARFPGVGWELNAQTVVQDFYRGFGFEPVGFPFDEDGIPHIVMRCDPRPAADDDPVGAVG
jgi:ElaA protein